MSSAPGLRILFVTDFYHPYSGGVEIHVRTVARALADRGHRVAVATLATPDGEPERTGDGPVEIHTVRHSAQVIGARFDQRDRAWAPPFPDPVAGWGLRRVVAEFRPDVIHGHDWLARSVMPRLVGGRIPLLTSLHYYTRTCAKKTLWRDGAVCPGPELRTCLVCAAQHYGRARGAVVTVGLRIGAALEDRRTGRWLPVSAATERGNGLAGRENSVVVANPVPGAAVSIGRPAGGPGGRWSQEPPGEVPEHPPPAGIPDGPFILFVGDIRPEKGVAVLARAVDLLRSEHGDHTPLVVVGQRMSNDLPLPEHTVEIGSVPHERVLELWRRATVGVVPSLWPEPFGLVAVEAMAAGCPLVASDIAGLAEILADGRAELVPPGDPRALARALADLLAEPDRRRSLAAAAQDSVGRFAPSVIVDRLEREYRTAIAGWPADPSSLEAPPPGED